MRGRAVSFAVLQPWLSFGLETVRLVPGRWLLHAGLDTLANQPFDTSGFVGEAVASPSPVHPPRPSGRRDVGPRTTVFRSQQSDPDVAPDLN
jgi:hypothetical protein